MISLRSSDRITRRLRWRMYAGALLLCAALSHTSLEGRVQAQAIRTFGLGLLPSMAADGQGGYYMIWVNHSEGVHLKHFDSQGQEITADSIIFARSIRATDIRIIVGSNYSIALWADQGSMETNIAGWSFKNSDMHTQTQFYPPTSDGRTNHSAPDALFLNDTLLFIAWNGWDPGSKVSGHLASVSGRAVGSRIPLSAHPIDSVSEGAPRLVHTKGSERFFAIWRDNSTGRDNLYGRSFDLNGTPLGDNILISDDPQMTGLFYYGVAPDTAGGFVVVWTADKGKQGQVECRWFTKDGTPSTTVQTLTALDTLVGSWCSVDVSIDERNRAVFVWEQEQTSPMSVSRIKGRCYDAGTHTPLGAMFKVSSETTGMYDIRPNVIATKGRIFITWENNPSSVEQNNITGASFDIDKVTAVSDGSASHAAVRAFSLAQNYPNPFNPSTQITFTLPERSRVALTIVNILGQHVATLVSEELPAGTHTRRWNAAGFPSGVYFYRLEAGGFTETKRLLLVK